MKRYDVVQIGNVEQLIYSVAECSTSIKYYVQIEDILATEEEIEYGHKVQKHQTTMYNDLSKHMHSMSKKVESSEKRFGCQANGFQCDEFPSTSLFDRYAKSGGWREQMDLVYQNHLTEFVQLRPVTSKRAPEIAYQLLDVLSIFDAPNILQSDNGREFVNSIIDEHR